MNVTVLTVPDCPNGPVLDERLTEVLAARPGVTVTRRVITDERAAAASGMHGSPTLLIDGVDPFAAPDTPPGLSCRLYRDPEGNPSGAPSVTALHHAFRLAEREAPAPGGKEAAAPGGEEAERRAPGGAGAAEPWEDALGRGGAGRLAPVGGGRRAVQRCVLRAFAATGRPPEPAALAAVAAPYAPVAVLAALHTADYLRLDATGRIIAAYPFSTTRTPHTVEITGGATAYAMCAIDALGIAAMLGATVRITSTDPHTAAPITITVPPSGPATWNRPTAVVLAARTRARTPRETDSRPPPATDVCCGHTNFFTTPRTAEAWSTDHPELTGRPLTPDQAEHLGTTIFGPLLT